MGSIIIFFTGGLGYNFIELLWRGSTHWTMTALGGICFLFIYNFSISYPNVNLITASLICGSFVTLTEFITGFIVNIKLGWHVWDYSSRAFNVLGQICPMYWLLWSGLCLVIIPLCRIFDRIITKTL